MVFKLCMMKRKEENKKDGRKRISNLHVCFHHLLCELAKLNSGASVTIVKFMVVSVLPHFTVITTKLLLCLK